jgi:hypothetical protein
MRTIDVPLRLDELHILAELARREIARLEKSDAGARHQRGSYAARRSYRLEALRGAVDVLDDHYAELKGWIAASAERRTA